MNDRSSDDAGTSKRAHARATHRWDDGVRYAGSIAEGPPPGKLHHEAIVHTCQRCYVFRIDPLTDEQKRTIGDDALFKQGLLDAYVKRSITAADVWWDGSPCPITVEHP